MKSKTTKYEESTWRKTKKVNQESAVMLIPDLLFLFSCQLRERTNCVEKSFEPVEVFCSFADGDVRFLQQLETHLIPLQREGMILAFYKRQIVKGKDWQVEIDQHLHTASLILLLVSPEFVASGYCYGTEMQQIMQGYKANKARVIPILLRSANWESTPFGNLAPLPDNGRPINEWPRPHDKVYKDIAQMLLKSQEFPPQGISSSSPSMVWTVPYRRNIHFTGRDALFERLDQHFTSTDLSKSFRVF